MPRSNPATYTGVFDSIRKLFASTNEAKVRGYMPGRFSFNVKGGRCEACAGDGTIKIEMHFLPDVYVPCEVCKGARYNRDTLDIQFKGKNIADVLDMPVSEAVRVLRQPAVDRPVLETLTDVGLGYVRLGQPAPTLSGGEAQRVKLATELAKRQTGHTLYLLDEPTTGLHFDDVRRLLTVLSRLVDQGNTVLVIEHNLDVIKTADWIIDLGPEGGRGGGTSSPRARPSTSPPSTAATRGVTCATCSTPNHRLRPDPGCTGNQNPDGNEFTPGVGRITEFELESAQLGLQLGDEVGVGRVGDHVGQLLRIGGEVVQLPLDRVHRAVGTGLAERVVVVADQLVPLGPQAVVGGRQVGVVAVHPVPGVHGGPPVVRAITAQQRDDASALQLRRHGDAAELQERRGEVDVDDEVVARRPGATTGG